MPFPMTHLLIANEILNRYEIENPGDFILGSIAPDSVHQREDFYRQMKFMSHLCVGDLPWGRIEDNEAWEANVLDFLAKDRTDFRLGYCIHVLSDIQNNIRIWTPFIQKHKHDLSNFSANGYHRESAILDKLLYKHPNRTDIWELLKKGKPQSLDGRCRQVDVAKIKEHILYHQYKEDSSDSIESFTTVTMEMLETFIEEVAVDIGNLLFEKP